ncbi:MAG: glycosyltransferase [Clostridium sp.]|nr:glycosyltransferase [Clostridium sp.]
MKISIPKKIHYCWFGGNKLNELGKKCINSWKKYCPEYEIIEWNDKNFDFSCNKYVQEAYKAKKWAFVSDYVRLYVIYKYGGIYMDTDVEVVKNLDKFLKYESFSGFESTKYIPTGIMGGEKNSRWIKYLLSYYDNKSFINEDGTLDTTTNVITITNMTKEKYNLRLDNSFQLLNEEVALFPSEFFCPKDYETEKINITKNTHTIHHFSGSWQSDEQRRIQEKKKKYTKIFGKGIGNLVYDFYYIKYKIKNVGIKKSFKAIIKRLSIKCGIGKS